mmetsp:Transcript_28441/g.80831  ORF Transcript_28441/g.80831 Transcript_28441/m.80831 type:complete len:726 (-) Transcript_28441:28-2205(-)
MKLFRATVLLAGLLAAPASASPVERVVNLLKDLKTKLEMDEKVEQKVYDRYACWCERTTERKAASIAEAQADLRAYGQTILSLKGKVATLGAEIVELAEAIEANKAEVEEATALREKGNAAYVAETSETKQALAALEKAITVLVAGSTDAKKGGAALIQERARAASAVRSVIAAVPARTGLSNERASALSEFLQQGSAERHAPQSFTVQGILKDMYDTFAADVESATRDEAAANTKFEDFLAIKAVELRDMEAEKVKKEGEKAAAEVRLADTQEMYDDTAAQKEADVAFFDDTKAACEAKHEEWSTRSELRAEEIAGVAKALEILTADGARELFASAIKPGKEVHADDRYDTGREIALVQLGSVSAPLRAYAVLKDHAKASHSLRLAALALKVRECKVGHFDKVIAAIDEMVKALKEENLADIAKRDQCKEEYLKIESTSKDLTWKIKNNVAKIDKLTKLIELRTAQKEKTIQEIADVEEHMRQLTAMREEENTDFLDAKKEDQDAIDLLMAARDALSSYYANHSVAMGEVQGSVKGAALLQQPVFNVSADQAPDADFTDKGHHKNEAKGIVSILTMIIEDLDDEIKNGMKAEEESQLEYESQMHAAKKLKEELVAKKVSLEEAIAKRGEEKEAETEDKTENEAALADETQYKASIKNDCDWIIGAFEKRAAARVSEMDGLAGAKEFLVGYQPPSQEASLLEQRQGAKPFDDAALAKVRFLGMRR